jgi:P4 family phage/plasmid primase-like protien
MPSEAHIAHIAKQYTDLGWAPIPVPLGQKGPVLSAWQTLRLTPEELPAYFPGPMNIGVLLGTASNHLCDIDLDCPEAIAIASHILPHSACRFGRRSRPNSHWLYTAHGAKSQRWTDEHGQVLLELRSDGAQTIFPGSVHPSGERVEFDSDMAAPAVLDYELLVGACNRLAAACVLARCWPAHGSRHAYCLALGGWLLRGGLDKDDVIELIGAAAGAAGDDEIDDRIRCVEDTAVRLGRGEPATGLPSIADVVGRKNVERITRWLHLHRAPRAESLGEGQVFTRSGFAEASADIDVRCALLSCDDIGNAERFVARHGHNASFCPGVGAWFIWNGSVWRKDETSEITRLSIATARAIWKEFQAADDPSVRERLSKHAARSQSRQKVETIAKLAATLQFVLVGELDTDPMLLNCANGIVDLRTGERSPHRRDAYLTKMAPVEYEPDATCPRFMAFLDQITCGRQSLQTYLQRCFGYTLTGLTSAQCLFFLYGTGANGKTTLQTVLRDMLGDYVVQTPGETLMATRDRAPSNEIARLRGARVVNTVEIDDGKRMAESLVKQLTGADRISARFLYQEHFEFDPTFKLWIAANHKPAVAGVDEGIWRRIKLIPFDAFIPEKERDPDLMSKLRDELPGILAWAVRGCLAWQAEGLGEPSEVRDATSEYRAENDHVGAFLVACCAERQDGSVSAKRLFEAYCRWCSTIGEEPLLQREFGRRLTQRNIKREKVGTYFYTGLELRPDELDDVDQASGNPSKEDFAGQFTANRSRSSASSTVF